MDRHRWIVVGTDFSPAADRAVGRAAELATQLGASLAVVHAYEDPPATPLGVDNTPALEARINEAVGPVRERNPTLGIDCVIRRGPAWDKLINVACALGAEMIVIGSCGESASATQSFLGRVVMRVAAASSRLVLIVPTADRRDFAAA